MKKSFLTLAVSVLFLFVISFVAFGLSFLNLDFETAFGIGAGILAAGIVVFIVGRKNEYAKLASFILNALAMGFFLRSWYINRGFNNPLWLMLSVSLLAAAYLLIFLLPLYVNAINRHYGWYLAAFVIVSIVGYVMLVVMTKTTWVSTLGYFGLLELGFIMSLSFDGDKKSDLITHWAIASYTVAICALIILAIVLGGDGFDLPIDGIDGGVTSPRKTQKPQDPPQPIQPL